MWHSYLVVTIAVLWGIVAENFLRRLILFWLHDWNLYDIINKMADYLPDKSELLGE